MSKPIKNNYLYNFRSSTKCDFPFVYNLVQIASHHDTLLSIHRDKIEPLVYNFRVACLLYIKCNVVYSALSCSFCSTVGRTLGKQKYKSGCLNEGEITSSNSSSRSHSVPVKTGLHFPFALPLLSKYMCNNECFSDTENQIHQTFSFPFFHLSQQATYI